MTLTEEQVIELRSMARANSIGLGHHRSSLTAGTPEAVCEDLVALGLAERRDGRFTGERRRYWITRAGRAALASRGERPSSYHLECHAQ